MRRFIELHLDQPFAGRRMLRDLLRQEGIEIGRGHVVTLRKKAAIEAICRRPNGSKPAPRRKIYPYLLCKLLIVRPNQMWATDISHVPMARDFVYFVAIVDWFSRNVLAWRVSITMEAAFWVEALEEVLARYGRPEIFNSALFTSHAFTGVPPGGNRHLHGRPGRLARQCPRGAAVASVEVRGCLPPRLHRGQRGPHINWSLSGLLQREQAAFEPRRQDPGPCIFW